MTEKSTDHPDVPTDIVQLAQTAWSPILPPFISYKDIPPGLLFPEPALQILDKFSNLRLPVLVVGEKGLGQSYFAKLFHEAVSKKEESLLELYVGKNSSPELLFAIFRQIPDGKPFRGTLHVYGLENASYMVQRLLLQMLEERQIDLSDGRHICFEGCMVAYVYEPLESLLSRGTVLPELYYKLDIAPIFLKPLRERCSDIHRFADIFLKECSERLMLSAKQFSSDAIQCLQDYPWPGNVPELECVMYRSMLFAQDSVLAGKDILFERTLKKEQIDKQSDKNGKSQPIALKKEQTPSPQKEEASPLAVSAGHLVAEFSHEIKNPMVAIKTFIQLLPSHINDPEFLSEFFGVAARSIDRIDYLTERLHEYAKFTAPCFSQINLSLLISEALKNENAQLQKLRISLESEFPENLPDIHADREHLLYALENILLHIAHNTGSDQNVRVGIEQSDSSIVLTLSYSGKKQVQGVAFANSRGEGISDLMGLDFFLAQQILEKNAVQFSSGSDSYYAYVTLQFPVQYSTGKGEPLT